MRPQFKFVLDQIVQEGKKVDHHFEATENTINYAALISPSSRADFRRKTVRFYFEYRWRDMLKIPDVEEWYSQNREMMRDEMDSHLKNVGLYERPSLYERYQTGGGMRKIYELFAQSIRDNYLRITLSTTASYYLSNENVENHLADAKAYEEAYRTLLPEHMRDVSGVYVLINFKEVLINHYNLTLELRKLTN